MSVQSVVDEIIQKSIETGSEATTQLIGAVIFVLIAIGLFRVLKPRIDSVISSISENRRDEQLISVIVSILFYISLTTVFLLLLGFERIATALGTLSGLVVLVVSYALREALREIAAGIYLVHDEEFVEGNKITADNTTGEISEVGLRRARIEEKDGDVTILSNTKIETKWTHHRDEEE